MSETHRVEGVEPGIECLSLLGLSPPVTVEDVKQAYLDRVKTAHPDHGGDPQVFMQLHAAFQQATEYAQFKAGRLQWLSQWVGQYADQQQLIDWLRALGGIVQVESVDWLTRTIGVDFATVLDRVVAIELTGPKINDAVLLKLANWGRVLAELRTLKLVGTSVTPRGLDVLHACQALQVLDLSGTSLDASAVGHLVGHLPRLESIGLANTGVGWWARRRLAKSNDGLTITI